MVGHGKLGAPKDPAILNMSPTTAYEYMVDLFPCTTAITKSSGAGPASGTRIRLSSVSDISRSSRISPRCSTEKANDGTTQTGEPEIQVR